MNKQKRFSYKDQEIINEYNKKRNKEITEEHLNNIKKLRADFKKEVINEYKEKLISYLLENSCTCHLECLCNVGDLHIIVEKIQNGEFD